MKHDLEKYLDIAGNIILVLNTSGEITLLNEKGCELLSISNKKEALGKNWFDEFLFDVDINKVKIYFHEIMNGKLENVEYVENYIKDLNGNKKLIAWRNSLIYDDNGQIIGTLSSGEDITLKRETELKYKNIFIHSPIGICYFNTEYIITDANFDFANVIGSSVDEIIGFNLKKNLTDKKMIKAYTDVFKFGKSTFEGFYTSVISNQKHYLKLNLIAIKDNEGNIIAGVCIAQNLSNEKNLEENILFEQGHNQNIINAMGDSLRIIDQEYNIINLDNSTREKLKGNKYIQDIDNIKCYELSHHYDSPCTLNNHSCPLNDAKLSGEQSTDIHLHFDKDNNETIEQVSITPLKNNTGQIYAYLEHTNDVTELFNIKKKFDFQRDYDPLTELPNKSLFMKNLEQLISQSTSKDTEFCLLILNIDNFKFINDSFGHDTGDEVIKEFSNLLSSSITDIDMLSRITGDSFAISLNKTINKADIVSFIEQIQHKTENSILEVMYNDINISFSVGIARYPTNGISSDILFKNANSALHYAKDNGKNTYKFYSEDLTQKAFDKIILESNIRKAVQEEKFTLYYQPQYNSATNKLIGMEVLIRWLNSPIGIVSPDKFIPILESSKLMDKVGYWIIEEVFKKVSQWSNRNYNFGKVSINISLMQLNEGDKFIDNILYLLDKTNCNPSHIGLEITESMLMENHDIIIQTLNKLSKIGFYLSIDDFGTGYSSLSYLKQMPIKKLKIDQSFIKGLPNDQDDSVIVKTIIDLAKNLELEVIAEGAETQEQVDFLLEYGCTDIQGYLYSKPLDYNGILEKIQ